MGVQSSLFSLGLELEASQRSLRQSQRQGDDLMRFRDRLNSDLQEAMQHREVTEKHNQVRMVVKLLYVSKANLIMQRADPLVSLPQDLQCSLQKTRSELQAKESALKASEAEKHTVVQEKDRCITQLKRSLQDKEQQLQVNTKNHSVPRKYNRSALKRGFLIRICRSTRTCWNRQETPNREMRCYRS